MSKLKIIAQQQPLTSFMPGFACALMTWHKSGGPNSRKVPKTRLFLLGFYKGGEEILFACYPKHLCELQWIRPIQLRRILVYL
jgi:hypothetical protein